MIGLTPRQSAQAQRIAATLPPELADRFVHIADHLPQRGPIHREHFVARFLIVGKVPAVHCISCGDPADAPDIVCPLCLQAGRLALLFVREQVEEGVQSV